MVKELLSNEEFDDLLREYDYNFQKGDLIKGTVWSYDAEGAVVDIGGKSPASVSSKEVFLEAGEKIENVLKKGETYEFLIIREEDEEDGKYFLSRRKVEQAYTWQELKKLKDNDDTIMGSIVASVKGGLLVEILGIRGFVPSSHLRIKETEFAAGEKLELKILTLDSQQNNLILSNKKVYTENNEELKKTIFSQIEMGQVLKGEIVRIADFGAFIDLGGIDGLLPLSQISWKWVDHPSDVLKIGEKIDVEVISVDHDKHRVSLSLKSLEPDPWVEAQKEIEEGALRKGLITRIKNFGAFVEVYPGVEALLPQNEVLEYQNQHNVLLKVGETIETTVIKFNPTDKRIALSVKEEPSKTVAAV